MRLHRSLICLFIPLASSRGVAANMVLSSAECYDPANSLSPGFSRETHTGDNACYEVQVLVARAMQAATYPTSGDGRITQMSDFSSHWKLFCGLPPSL
jgi:hypothetical protein